MTLLFAWGAVLAAIGGVLGRWTPFHPLLIATMTGIPRAWACGLIEATFWPDDGAAIARLSLLGFGAGAVAGGLGGLLARRRRTNVKRMK